MKWKLIIILFFILYYTYILNSFLFRNQITIPVSTSKNPRPTRITQTYGFSLVSITRQAQIRPWASRNTRTRSDLTIVKPRIHSAICLAFFHCYNIVFFPLVLTKMKRKRKMKHFSLQWKGIDFLHERLQCNRFLWVWSLF